MPDLLIEGAVQRLGRGPRYALHGSGNRRVVGERDGSLQIAMSQRHRHRFADFVERVLASSACGWRDVRDGQYAERLEAGIGWPCQLGQRVARTVAVERLANSVHHSEPDERLPSDRVDFNGTSVDSITELEPQTPEVVGRRDVVRVE